MDICDDITKWKDGELNRIGRIIENYKEKEMHIYLKNQCIIVYDCHDKFTNLYALD